MIDAHGTSCQVWNAAWIASVICGSVRSSLPAELIRYGTGMRAAGHTMPLVANAAASASGPGRKAGTPAMTRWSHLPWLQP